MVREPIPDRSQIRDVRERERLMTERERCDVVPARKILGAHDRPAFRSEHTPQLGDEVIDALDVLDHLVRVDDVDGTVRERPRLFEIADVNVEAAGASQLGPPRHQLEPTNLLGWNADPQPQLFRPGAVVATDVEEDNRAVSRQRVEDLRSIGRFSIRPQTLRQSWQHQATVREGARVRGRPRRFR